MPLQYRIRALQFRLKLSIPDPLTPAYLLVQMMCLMWDCAHAGIFVRSTHTRLTNIVDLLNSLATSAITYQIY